MDTFEAIKLIKILWHSILLLIYIYYYWISKSERSGVIAYVIWNGPLSCIICTE